MAICELWLSIETYPDKIVFNETQELATIDEMDGFINKYFNYGVLDWRINFTTSTLYIWI